MSLVKPSQAVALLTQSKNEILKALPKHLSAERFARIALTELRKNPMLAECDPYSFLGAVMQCAQLGLEPGNGLGHAYLIPFRNKKQGIIECQFMPGFRGLIDLARRSGQIVSLSARVVREKDKFSYAYGDDEQIKHIPFEGPEDEAGRITHAYAVAKLKDGGIQREVMTRAQIDSVRRNSNNNPIWDKYFDEMARKTVIRRIAKYLPMSSELVTAVEADNAAYNGESQANWKVISDTYEPFGKPDVSAYKDALAKAEAPLVTPQEAKKAAAAREALIIEFDAMREQVIEDGGDINKLLGNWDPDCATNDEITAQYQRLVMWSANKGSLK